MAAPVLDVNGRSINQARNLGSYSPLCYASSFQTDKGLSYLAAMTLTCRPAVTHVLFGYTMALRMTSTCRFPEDIVPKSYPTTPGALMLFQLVNRPTTAGIV